MPNEPFIIIAKRSLNLGITYAVIGAIISVIGIVFSNLAVLTSSNLTNVPSESSGKQALSTFPLLAIPMITFGALALATTVVILYVYDKNNGVLEYFLSVGMDQQDIYMGYLKASLLLATILLVIVIPIDIVTGLLLGNDRILLLDISFLTPLLALSTVSFVNIIMMAFSSLQKQRVGSNQPLGIALGFVVVMPTYVVPFVFPSFATQIDLIIIACIDGLSLGMFFLASRLIKREKLLP